MTAKKNLLIIYMGNGKGKTTAALGLASRMLGHDKNVCICQFIKQDSSTGEYKFFDNIENAEIYLLGNGFVFDDKNKESHRKSARDALAILRQKILSSKYSLIIADEMLDAIELGFIEPSEVIELVDYGSSTLLLTGRKAPKELIEQADTITEMKEVKHHYQKGLKAVKGIEF